MSGTTCTCSCSPRPVCTRTKKEEGLKTVMLAAGMGQSQGLAGPSPLAPETARGKGRVPWGCTGRRQVSGGPWEGAVLGVTSPGPQEAPHQVPTVAAIGP